MDSERDLSHLQDIVPHIQSNVHVPSSDQGVPPSVTIFEQTSLGTNPPVLTQVSSCTCVLVLCTY